MTTSSGPCPSTTRRSRITTLGGRDVRRAAGAGDGDRDARLEIRGAAPGRTGNSAGRVRAPEKPARVFSGRGPAERRVLLSVPGAATPLGRNLGRARVFSGRDGIDRRDRLPAA